MYAIYRGRTEEDHQSTMCAPKANSVVKEPESRENVSSFEPCCFSVNQSARRGKNKSHQKKKGSFVPPVGGGRRYGGPGRGVLK